MLTHKRRKGTNTYLLISSTNEELFFLADDFEDAIDAALEEAEKHSLTIRDIKLYA